ncbi:MAG TPA: hypothetical protein VJ765_01155 [Chitinophagaceae bacterium]|nr:hypothetical protein [Chitinophagaceae bacterium]
MRKLRWLLVLMIPIVIVSCKKDSTEDLASEEVTSKDETGNGAPSGQHYNLNIIGVEKGKSISGGSGHVIFVPLWGKCKIMLTEGVFDVIDKNGTDGTAAFQLPEPDAEDDNQTDYCVFIRALGKPGGSATMKSCLEEFAGQDSDGDGVTGETYCSTDTYIVNLTAHGNGNKFQNVTNQLLYVWADIDGDGDLDRVELFDDDFESYWWDYDNSGLRLAQMRFYPNCSITPDTDPE